MHLAFDERIDLVMARLFLSYKAEDIPVCLQRALRTYAALAFVKEPVEEGMYNVDRNSFEGEDRVFLGELAVSGRVD